MIHRLDTAGSTNSVLAGMTEAPSGTVVTARTQTAGRGQRGNTWESAPGANVTLSMLFRPEGVRAPEQFVISEAAALSVVDAVAPWVAAEVKWPNDVYDGRDRKLAGILIENTLTGSGINRSIIGIGLNVNQRKFVSDAPNPVSLLQISGKELDRDEVEGRLIAALEARLAQADKPGERGRLHEEYLSRLWRGRGMYPWRLPDGRSFEAEIADVALTGHLTLRRADGRTAVFAFKEVAAVL